MGKRNARRRMGNGVPSGLVIVGGLFGLIILVALATAFANGVVSANYPTLRAAVVWAILIASAIEAFLLWRLWNNRRRSKHEQLKDLLALTPTQFELAILDLLRDLGYRDVLHLGGAGDLAADLKAIDQSGRNVVVQCKRLAPGTRIGSPDIQKFIGMTIVHHRAQRGIFVTTAGYSTPAISLARQHSIELWDGAMLANALDKLHRSGISARRIIAKSA